MYRRGAQARQRAASRNGSGRVGPTLNRVGGPASSKKAAQRCTDAIWTVGPTLING